MTVISKMYSSVYLVQPELVLDTNIYKFGINKGSGKRIKSYGKKTIVIRDFHTERYEEIEAILKIQFKKKFKLVKGKEYFEGNLQEMIEIFDKVCNMFGTFESEEREKHKENFKNVLNDINKKWQLGPWERDFIYGECTVCYPITTFKEWLEATNWIKNIVIIDKKDKTGYLIPKNIQYLPRYLEKHDPDPYFYQENETLYGFIEHYLETEYCYNKRSHVLSEGKCGINYVFHREMPIKEQVNLIIKDLLKQRIEG